MSNPEAPGQDQALALALISMTETVQPIHEWLAGQRAMFLSQGYTDDEARAMAAAEFVCVFGASIARTPGGGQ